MYEIDDPILVFECYIINDKFEDEGLAVKKA